MTILRRDLPRFIMAAGAAASLPAIVRRATAQPVTPEEVLEIATDAYLFGYPLIAMEITRARATNVRAPQPNGFGPPNRWVHLRAFPDATFKEVVRPNADTLYSSAWLDLRREPVAITVPEAPRYYLLPMLDMWTNVFAVPGTRVTGNGAQAFLVAGPDWRGEQPAGLRVIRSPTPIAWIIGRTQTNGAGDYAAVHGFQDGMRMLPLSAWARRESYVPPPGEVDSMTDMRTPPVRLYHGMDAEQFFSRVTELLRTHPASLLDQPMLARMRRIGLEPGQPFDWAGAPLAMRETLARSVAEGRRAVERRAGEYVGAGRPGWISTPPPIGVFGTEYLDRAAHAYAGLGVNLREDAIYPQSSADADGRPYDGRQRYVMRFERGQMPPVRAFWSITLYDDQNFFVPNEIDRYAIGDRDDLLFGPDGSLELLVQHERPSGERVRNWLPAPPGRFVLQMRLYWPKAEALNGSWKVPEIRRMER